MDSSEKKNTFVSFFLPLPFSREGGRGEELLAESSRILTTDTKRYALAGTNEIRQIKYGFRNRNSPFQSAIMGIRGGGAAIPVQRRKFISDTFRVLFILGGIPYVEMTESILDSLLRTFFDTMPSFSPAFLPLFPDPAVRSAAFTEFFTISHTVRPSFPLVSTARKGSCISAS
jgi:hypothetical protein